MNENNGSLGAFIRDLPSSKRYLSILGGIQSTLLSSSATVNKKNFDKLKRRPKNTSKTKTFVIKKEDSSLFSIKQSENLPNLSIAEQIRCEFM